MYSLNKRQSEIIRTLINRDDYMTIKDISEIFNVSERTIRYDLSQIKAFIKENNQKLESIPNRGTRLLIDNSKKKQIEKLLSTKRSYSLEEKIDLTLLELLTKETNTYDSIAESLNISRAAIINSFDKVIEKVKEYNLDLNKEKGKGISLSGNECLIYDCFISIIKNNYRNSLFSKDISIFYNEENLSLANNIISKVEKELKITIFDIEILDIIICFIIHRINLAYRIDKLTKNIKEVKKDLNYEKYMKALADTNFDDNHKTYIVSVLMNSKFRSLKVNKNNIGTSNEIAKFLLKELEKLHPLTKQEKEKFLLSLTTHLDVALYRIRNDIPIENILRDQIKICLPLTYEFTKKQLLKCEKKYNISFSEDEISYIAMYIGSVYETSVKTNNHTTVMLVCSFGMTTSTILESRIKELIPECNYVGPYSRKEALKYLENNNVDFIISTNDDEYNDIPVVVVNPLLYKEDNEYIRAQLFETNYNMLCKKFIDTYSSTIEDSNNTYLKDIVPIENIQIVDSIDTWQESIRLAAKPLLDKKQIEKRYVDKMIKAVEQLGTYMVILPETAFVHAGIEDGINEACCSLMVLRNPITFGESKAKMVRNVFVIGFKEKEKTTLLDLVNILNANDNLERFKDKDLDILTISNMHE